MRGMLRDRDRKRSEIRRRKRRLKNRPKRNNRTSRKNRLQILHTLYHSPKEATEEPQRKLYPKESVWKGALQVEVGWLVRNHPKHYYPKLLEGGATSLFLGNSDSKN
jgi:hypothetical protein